VRLVLAYGMGMAALTGASLLLVAVGDRRGRLTHLAGAYAPRVIAGLLVVVAIGLTIRAAIAL
jgi:hypothetical protein